MLFKTTSELKARLGFIYASFTFENLKPDLELASAEMRRLIGAEMYDAAEDFYEQYSVEYDNWPTDQPPTPYQLAMSTLVKMIQLPVGLNAYLAYAPNADLTHSDKGRQIFVSDNEKPAFEWQLERDEEATRNRMHRAIEELLRWLEDNTQEVYVIPSPYPENITLKAGQYFKYDYSDWVLFSKYSYSGPASITNMYELLDRNEIQFCYFKPELPNDYEAKSYGQWEDVAFGEKYYRSVMPGNENAPETGVFFDGDLWSELIMYPPYIPEYKQSSAWQKNNRLLINRIEMFEQAYPIDGSWRIFKALEPFRAEVERRTIRPIVGSDAFDALLERRMKDELTTDDEELIDFITPVVALKAMVKAVARLHVSLLPSGVLSQFASGTHNTRSKTDSQQRMQAAKSLSDSAATEIAALQMYLQRKAAEAAGTEFTPDDLMPTNSADNKYFAV